MSAANDIQADDAQHQAALAELDQRIQVLHDQVQALVRDAAALREERDQLAAALAAEQTSRATAGVKRIIVAGEDGAGPLAELRIDADPSPHVLAPGLALLDPGLATLVAQICEELATPPPSRGSRVRVNTVAAGRLTIGTWLESLRARGLELSTGLQTASELAQRLNPDGKVAEKARLSRQTIVLFRTHPAGRSMETLVRIVVAMGRADLLELRSMQPERSEVAEGTGWASPTSRTIN